MLGVNQEKIVGEFPSGYLRRLGEMIDKGSNLFIKNAGVEKYNMLYRENLTIPRDSLAVARQRESRGARIRKAGREYGGYGLIDSGCDRPHFVIDQT
jgi:hypothetical protein